MSWMFFFDGIATGIRYTGPITYLSINTPAGHVAVRDDAAALKAGDSMPVVAA